MPVPQVPELLASGVIDAVVVPWEVVPAVKIQELVQYHVQFPGTPTFYVATMLLAMNKASYEGMPDDLRADHRRAYRHGDGDPGRQGVRRGLGRRQEGGARSAATRSSR